MAPRSRSRNNSPSRIESGSPTKNNLHLRHQPRQNAEPDIENHAEDNERRRELNADAEGAGDHPGNQRRGIAGRRHLTGLEQIVAVVDRSDDEMMHVGGEEQLDAEKRQKIADHQPLLALGGIDGSDEAEAELLGDDGAGDFQRRDREPRSDAEHGADEDFLDQHHERRGERALIDVVGVAMQRQQHGSKQKREGQAHARRDVLLAEARQQHQHRAGARKHQEECRSQRRQVGEIDAHATTAPFLPLKGGGSGKGLPAARLAETRCAGRRTFRSGPLSHVARSTPSSYPPPCRGRKSVGVPAPVALVLSALLNRR
jgi:hypothetical protein